MKSGSDANPEGLERRAESRLEDAPAHSGDRVDRLRRKIRSGFYESKDIILQVVNKLLKDIKESKE